MEVFAGSTPKPGPRFLSLWLGGVAHIAFHAVFRAALHIVVSLCRELFNLLQPGVKDWALLADSLNSDSLCNANASA